MQQQQKKQEQQQQAVDPNKDVYICHLCHETFSSIDLVTQHLEKCQVCMLREQNFYDLLKLLVLRDFKMSTINSCCRITWKSQPFLI